jgi:predicted enzyme related to lactoylglutathione lyase
MIRYVHTNVIAKDWRRLADFYVTVLGCVPRPPERDLSGAWVDALTGLDGAHIRGMHHVLPGFGPDGPTLEVFQYDENLANPNKGINVESFGHLAFAVDDVEATLAAVVAHGGSALGQVVRNPVAGVGTLHVVYARDPEGNILELQRWT